MIIEEYKTKGCCGKTSVYLKLSKSITQDLAKYFIKNGFIQQEHFIKAGVFYLTSNDLILSGPFNSVRLQVKCKKNDCTESTKKVIEILENI